MTLTIPLAIGDVDAGFIDAALRAAGVLSGGATVANCDITYLGEGIGMLGDLARVVIEYSVAGAGPASVIVKMPTTHEANRNRGLAFAFYEREARLYELFTRTGRLGGLRVPKCYAAPMDVVAARFVLLLEDLDASGFVAADQVAGLQPDQARLAAEQLARFHAVWWGAVDTDALAWLPYSNSEVTKQAAPLMRDNWPLFVDRFGDCLTDDALALGPRVGACFEDLLDRLAATPRTIVHTDYRLDNLFFPSGGADAPLAVVDWQLTTRGRGAYDIAYLLGQSMEPGARAQHERAVLGTWHEALVAAGVSGYSRADAFDDYRLGALINLVIPVSLADMDAGNERGLELVRSISQRAFRAAVEIEADAVLPA
jgi:aminoglycoside/choline kinase family phosphotransferase